jgi:phage terminase small subunit
MIMPRMTEGTTLTAKQKRFCEEYVANGYKLVDAYMKAFDCSQETACANQWKLMKKDAIKDYIREIQHDRFEALGINADKIANELNRIAFEDPESTKAEKMKAIDLLQKQMGLQTQKVEADIKTTTITVGLEDDE